MVVSRIRFRLIGVLGPCFLETPGPGLCKGLSKLLRIMALKSYVYTYMYMYIDIYIHIYINAHIYIHISTRESGIN